MTAPQKRPTPRPTSSPPDFTYDPRTKRYRNNVTGRFTPDRQVRDALDGFLHGARSEMRGHTMLLREGRLSVAQWQTRMAQSMREVHVASYALAKGGAEAMIPADFGRLGASIRDELRYLRNFGDSLEAKLMQGQPIDGRALVRSELYAEAGRSTFERQLEATKGEAGYTHEYNELGTDDNCEDCLMYEAMGVVPIGTIPPPGVDRRCGRKCRCRKVYSIEPGYALVLVDDVVDLGSMGDV